MEKTTAWNISAQVPLAKLSLPECFKFLSRHASGLTCDFCVRSLRVPSTPTLLYSVLSDLHAHQLPPGHRILFWLSHAPSQPHLCTLGPGLGPAPWGVFLLCSLMPKNVKSSWHPWDSTYQVMTSPGLHAAGGSWGSPTPAAFHRTPGFGNSPE